ncbi:MAG: hypothetical protein C4B56_01285 [Candidatus Methanophagaceae archaeon]|nr:MAG: hypothetical protein C4B56_01285 [Methanophagales archaeon]
MKTEMRIAWKPWEIASIAALTAIFIVIATINLGALEIPSSCWQPHDHGTGTGIDEVVLDFGAVQPLGDVYIFLRDANRTVFDLYGSASTSTPPGGDEWKKLYSYDNLEKVHFCNWDKIELNTNARFLKFHFTNESTGKIGEILVLSRANRRIAIKDIEGEGSSRLIDEQNRVQLPVTQEDGAYFDEMYFVRTAWEYMNFKEPYEWTHPPLGKLIIALGILIFGMNPFGWRFLGVLAAAAMIPIMFSLSRLMFKSGGAGIFAASLLTFDFMHFSLARLATGEIYLALFSLLSFFFAFLYLYRGSPYALFLSIVSCGLCFTVKWTAFFGFIAILALMLVCKKRDWELVLAGLLVSAAIYLASYIPSMLAGGGHGLIDVFKLQFRMFGYHAGIGATHSFSSPWWSWQLMLKPLWMYSNTLDGTGTVSTVVLMGNPAIWWGSIPALGFIVIQRLIRKFDYTALFIVLPFLLLWLPYALITRILFIYHFVADVPFMILAITYCMTMLQEKRRLFLFAMLSFVILAVALFALFYPVISGYPIAVGYKDSLKWLTGWIF